MEKIIIKKKIRQFFREIEIRLYSIQQQQHYVVDPQVDQKPFLNPEFNDLLVEYQNWEMQQQQLQNQTFYNSVNENNENVLVNNGANAGGDPNFKLDSDGMDTNESTSTTSPNRSENEIPSPPPPQQQVEFSNYGESISELLDRQYCYSHSVATIY